MRTRVLSGILAVTFAALLFAAAGTTAHASNYGHHGGYYGGYYGGQGNVHCMKYGETLYGVAAMYGTTAWAIANANGIVNPNYVRAGQCLRIPTGYHGGYAKPKPAPYYGGYAKPAPYYGGYGHNANYNYHHGNKGGYGHTHCMKYGETLSGVAAMYGSTAWAIANANGIKNPNYVRAGTCLTIPRW